MARPPLELETWGKIRRTTVDGKPAAVAYFRDSDGKTRKMQRQGKTPAEAERNLIRAMKTRLAPAGEDLTADTTVKQAAEKWLAEPERAELAIATVRRYTDILGTIVKNGFGSVRLDALNDARIAEAAARGREPGTLPMQAYGPNPIHWAPHGTQQSVWAWINWREGPATRIPATAVGWNDRVVVVEWWDAHRDAEHDRVAERCHSTRGTSPGTTKRPRSHLEMRGAGGGVVMVLLRSTSCRQRDDDSRFHRDTVAAERPSRRSSSRTDAPFRTAVSTASRKARSAASRASRAVAIAARSSSDTVPRF